MIIILVLTLIVVTLLTSDGLIIPYNNLYSINKYNNYKYNNYLPIYQTKARSNKYHRFNNRILAKSNDNDNEKKKKPKSKSKTKTKSKAQSSKRKSKSKSESKATIMNAKDNDENLSLDNEALKNLDADLAMLEANLANFDINELDSIAIDDDNLSETELEKTLSEIANSASNFNEIDDFLSLSPEEEEAAARVVAEMGFEVGGIGPMETDFASATALKDAGGFEFLGGGGSGQDFSGSLEEMGRSAQAAVEAATSARERSILGRGGVRLESDGDGNDDEADINLDGIGFDDRDSEDYDDSDNYEDDDEDESYLDDEDADIASAVADFDDDDEILEDEDEIIMGSKSNNKNKSSNTTGESNEEIVIDGVKLKDEDVGLVDPPPLEEFKRLMESLGPSSLFEDEEDSLFDDNGDFTGKKNKAAESSSTVNDEKRDDNEQSYNNTGKRYEDPWYQNTYRGGIPETKISTEVSNITAFQAAYFANPPIWLAEDEEDLCEPLFPGKPEETAVIVHAMVLNYTWFNPETNVTTPIHTHVADYVRRIFDYLKNGTDNNFRIKYIMQVLPFQYTGKSEPPPLSALYQNIDPELSDDDVMDIESKIEMAMAMEDNIQMFLTSYNTYHLIDGIAMKEAWGTVMPDILFSEKNLEAILNQVKTALWEMDSPGEILSPRQLRVRFRGGAQEMSSGYNTEFLESDFSVVSTK